MSNVFPRNDKRHEVVYFSQLPLQWCHVKGNLQNQRPICQLRKVHNNDTFKTEKTENISNCIFKYFCWMRKKLNQIAPKFVLRGPIQNKSPFILVRTWCHFGHCLTHWGRVTHTCVGKLTITGSDNGLLPGRRQAIIWTNAGILLIGPLGTNFNEILIAIETFSFKNMHLKISSAKWSSFCLSLNVLN